MLKKNQHDLVLLKHPETLHRVSYWWMLILCIGRCYFCFDIKLNFTVHSHTLSINHSLSQGCCHHSHSRRYQWLLIARFVLCVLFVCLSITQLVLIWFHQASAIKRISNRKEYQKWTQRWKQRLATTLKAFVFIVHVL